MSRIKKLVNSDLQELMDSFSIRDMQELINQNNNDSNNRVQIPQQYWQQQQQRQGFQQRSQQLQQYWQGFQQQNLGPQIAQQQQNLGPQIAQQQNLGPQIAQQQQNLGPQIAQQQKVQIRIPQDNQLKDPPQNIKWQTDQLDLLKDIKDLLESILGKDKVGCCPSNSFQPCPPKPSVSTKKFNNYYDVFHRIAVAGPTDPNDPDSPVYNREPIFPALNRNSEIINVANHGNNLLFVRESHVGISDFDLETPVFPGTVRTFYNIFEIRLRSPKLGLAYSVSEYALASAFEVTPTPIEKANLQDVSLPSDNTDWLSSDINPTFPPSNFDIQVAVSIQGIFNAAIKRNGDVQVVNLNPSGQLVSSGLYRFSLMIHPGDSLNFRYSTSGGVIQNLRVHETA